MKGLLRWQQFLEWFSSESHTDRVTRSLADQVRRNRQEYVITFRLELPHLVAHENAFRKQLEREHQKRWEKFVRRHWFRQTKRQTKSRLLRFAPAIIMTVGGMILANALWPIAAYFIFTSPDLSQPKLVSPLPENPVVRQSPIIPQAQANFTAPEMVKPKIIRDNLDYTNLASWFPSGGEQVVTEAAADEEVREYYLDIPSLGVERALVRVGGVDLDNNLIQYPGTADPGEFGAPVIFGHSVLRQFYNPSLKNPRRYMSIFSKIMTLKAGDKIYVEYDGIRYTYSVVKKVEVKPEDVYILEQEYNARQLKLITCTPEGTYLRRGVVLAQLETVEPTDTRGENQ